MSSRAHIDWDAAFGYFYALGPTRTFAQVAARFGVSDVAVGKGARRERWKERVAELDARTRRKLEDNAVRERSVRIAETVALVDEVRQELLRKVRKGDAEVRLSDFPALAKLELLLEGEATSRVEVAEVRTVINLVFQTAGRFVPFDRRGEYLLAIDEALLHLPALGKAAEETSAEGEQT